MPTMSRVPEPTQKHVPAWKKLGLKLKYAEEEPEDAQTRQNDTVNKKKRRIVEKEDAAVENSPVQRSTKKIKNPKSRAEETGEAVNGNGISHGYGDANKLRNGTKMSGDSTEESAEAVNGKPECSNRPTNLERPSKKARRSRVETDVSTISTDGKNGGTIGAESSTPPALKTTPASRGKSVSFTPDTKTGDGDSVKGLYKTWIAKQIATDPSFDPSTISPALRSIVPSTIVSPGSPSPVISTATSNSDATTTANKKPIRKIKTRLPKISSDSGPSRFDPVLTYLTTHHVSPRTWKFSKSHQNQILKHLFSLKHIPPSYDSALLPYIRGLKGTSARSRVRKDALAVREEDEQWLESEPPESERMKNETAAQCNARRRRDYEAAVTRMKQTLEAKEDEREERESELLGENREWEERYRKRRRAEILLWCVGEEGEVVDSHPSSRQDPPGGDEAGRMDSGITQLVRAARIDPGPAPRVGRGVGMGMGGVEVIDAGGIARASRGKKVVFAADDGPAPAFGMKDKANGFDRGGGGGVVNGVKPSSDMRNGVKPMRKRKHKRRTGVPDDDDSSSSSSSSSSEEEEQQPPQKRAKESSDSDSDSSSGTSSSDSD